MWWLDFRESYLFCVEVQTSCPIAVGYFFARCPSKVEAWRQAAVEDSVPVTAVVARLAKSKQWSRVVRVETENFACVLPREIRASTASAAAWIELTGPAYRVSELTTLVDMG